MPVAAENRMSPNREREENTGRDREREREETLQRFFGTVASPGSARPPLGHRGDGGRPPRARARRPRDAPAARRSLGGAAAASPPRREGAPDAERPGYLEASSRGGAHKLGNGGGGLLLRGEMPLRKHQPCICRRGPRLPRSRGAS
ncbi:unnamed protein product [Prorocentrum cordatum]|uniref:Uncharacterized protein n=1 Tax=Prorocentrum cordatum TaxID=2364126 RepID=A0ABN9W830_9DINO|nr:unnamed protein product [Polarella glacialis]